MRHEPRRGLRAEDSVALCQRADGVDDLLGWVCLDQKADRSCLEGVVDVLVNAVGGEPACARARSAGG